MTERSNIPSPEAPEAENQDQAEAGRAAKRPPGRPKGSDYRGVDAPRHREMRDLLEQGEVPTLTAAAWAVVDRAYGGKSNRLAKVRRLVRTYPYPYPP